mmetsp:Transcript_19089/g.26706  ORF Transcript_19089/g.26706 Transcript_19089/m.26706 type:complete len:441 (+) Transcript_19089:196-1518(+)|eukprot:CAMPEP_0184485090 /NCGR_PEP_ID=MMETSP0113_2-20130426/6732_1 /TAXON_ID=91329 /ORGANISM="Norrisiella sphaerica, Strain BC52" /LENGTH=440 /DNA_ID=CAMNT_0026866377 /DNA_START=164 /DNA_END=1486 /DNA_ORIENTATION=-
MTQEATYPADYLDEEVDPSQGDRAWGRLIETNEGYPGKELFEDEVTIGRRSNCTIQVGHVNVSGIHCKIVRKDNGSIITICDMSRNGTTVGKTQLKKEEILLVDGAEIILVPKLPGSKKISFNLFLYKKAPKILSGPELKYHIRDVLGSGAFATVKLCVDRKSGKKYAIKIVDKNKFKMKNHSNRPNVLQDEVKILQEMNHEHIIKIIEVFDSSDKLQLVLELVTGGDLFDAIINYHNKHDHGFTETKAREIFRQLISAVEYMHEKKVAHRDLKPENILLRDKESDFVKISDFGLSRFVGEGSFLKTLCGTPMYLAPEVLPNSKGGSSYGFECDLWSLGAILYVMLSGCSPFDDDNPKIHILDQVKEGMYDFPSDSFGHVGEDAKDLIRNLLCVDPKKRYTIDQVKKHRWMDKKEKQSIKRKRRRVRPKENGDGGKRTKT